MEVAASPSRAALAVILGGAACVWEDVEKLAAMIGKPWPGLVVAVNDIGSHWPARLDHWCTLHPEKLPDWKRVRAERGHPNGYVTWTRRQRGAADRQISPWGGGSSGLLGVQVANDQLKATRIVLCGIPMTKTPHFEQSLVHRPERPWVSADAHFKPWKTVSKLHTGDRVRSMSGRTAELLGVPTLDWLTADGDNAQES